MSVDQFQDVVGILLQFPLEIDHFPNYFQMCDLASPHDQFIGFMFQSAWAAIHHPGRPHRERFYGDLEWPRPSSFRITLMIMRDVQPSPSTPAPSLFVLPGLLPGEKEILRL